MGKEFKAGVVKAIPIAVGYIPIGMAYGVLASSLGIPAWFVLASSLLVFAGSSQFMAVNLLTLGTALWEVVLTTFIVNARGILQSAAVASKLAPDTERPARALLGALTVDETFSVISLMPTRYVNKAFAFGVSLTAYCAWSGSTLLGLLTTDLLPPVLADSMIIGIYALFIGMLVPALKYRPAAHPAVIVAAICNLLLYFAGPYLGISQGIALFLATVAAVLVTARKGGAP